MTDVDDAQLKNDLNRLARALVPDDADSDVDLMPWFDLMEAAGDSGDVMDEWTFTDRGAEVDLGTIHRDHTRWIGPKRGRLMTAAAVILLVAGGAGLVVGSQRRHDPAASAPTTVAASSGRGTDPALQTKGPWTDGVAMIVYVAPGATQAEIDTIRETLVNAPDLVDVDRLSYLDATRSLAEAAVVLADDPGGFALLNVENIPTSFKVVPVPGREGDLRTLTDRLSRLPGVNKVSFADDPPERALVTQLDRPLARGMIGDDVGRLQSRLLQLGFFPGVTDGEFGSTTTQAVWAYETLVLKTPRENVTGIVTNDMWQTMQQLLTIEPRRPGQGTHVEIYLPEQVLAVFTDNTPTLITHISSGKAASGTDPSSWCETIRIDTDDNGNPIDPPQNNDVCGVAYTPGGVFHIQHAVVGDRVGPLGRMQNPVYFNYGIAIYGNTVVPARPSSRGGVRIDQTLSETFQNYVHLQDTVYVWGEDGKQPEDYTKLETTPVFNHPDPNITATSTPDTANYVYVVNGDETLVDIAKMVGATVDEIAAVNTWVDGAAHVLHPGDKIFLPPKTRVAPLLTGLAEEVASQTALDNGLVTTISYQDVPNGSPNDGRVLAQTPPVGTTVPAGSSLQITVGRALSAPTTTS